MRIKTLKQAKELIEKQWVEISTKHGWVVAETDNHRPATKNECRLLDQANSEMDIILNTEWLE